MALALREPFGMRRHGLNASRLLWETLKPNRLIALLAPQSAEACVNAYETLHPLGVVLEIALRTGAALDGIAAVRSRYPDALLLAGTAMTSQQAERAIAAGVAGVVSPDYFPPVVATCVANDIMCIPAGLGDVGKQLVQKAEFYGCSLEGLRENYPYQWVHKLFPAMAGSPTALELAASWKTVYEDLTIVYAGGVSASNLNEIVRRDSASIICSSALTRDLDDAESTRAEAKRWLANLHGETAAKDTRRRPSKIQHAPVENATVVTFGEIMLRLSPSPGRRLSHATHFDVSFGGAEANVAVALAHYGLASRFVTAVPEHAIGQAAINTLRSFGVDITHVLRQGQRLGVYYLEHGASQRPAQVIYDRSGSSASEIRPGQIDWEAAMSSAGWFHWSGITPALSASTAQVTVEALQAAKRVGATVSVDLNYRAKLWPPERAQEVLTPMMQHVDIAIGNEDDAAQVFGLHAVGADASAGRLDVGAYRDVAEQMIARFGCRMVAITLRESLSASENRWSACLHDGKEFHQSQKYTVQVVDRVGSGDAFAAGLIYGLISGKSAGEALEFAVAASCLKHSIRGDFNLVSVPEVEALAAGDVAGRIRR
jgi:2-dehydro-3-deoxygluconokinase